MPLSTYLILSPTFLCGVTCGAGTAYPSGADVFTPSV